MPYFIFSVITINAKFIDKIIPLIHEFLLVKETLIIILFFSNVKFLCTQFYPFKVMIDFEKIAIYSL